MFVNQVALVSQTKRISLDQLTKVGAALQKQISRDVAPHWGIDATVDVFAQLKDVPLGYWHIVLRDDIPYRAAGIHLNRASGQPYALVRYSGDWSLTTSHEAIEMLVDPSGNRVVAGDSVKEGQGRVEYLVEVCDPSEAPEFAYSVNGVLVSDFYLQSFFNPLPAAGVQYSFKGAIEGPRQVLDGGYLSWREPVSGHLWQLFVDGGEREFVDQGPIPSDWSGSLRSLSDHLAAQKRGDRLAGEAERASAIARGFAGSPSLLDRVLEANAAQLQWQIDRLVGGE